MGWRGRPEGSGRRWAGASPGGPAPRRRVPPSLCSPVSSGSKSPRPRHGRASRALRNHARAAPCPRSVPTGQPLRSRRNAGAGRRWRKWSWGRPRGGCAAKGRSAPLARVTPVTPASDLYIRAGNRQRLSRARPPGADRTPDPGGPAGTPARPPRPPCPPAAQRPPVVRTPRDSTAPLLPCSPPLPDGSQRKWVSNRPGCSSTCTAVPLTGVSRAATLDQQQPDPSNFCGKRSRIDGTGQRLAERDLRVRCH